MIVTLPQRRGIDLTVAAPPSKSYTHRALIAAALAQGTSTIVHPLASPTTQTSRSPPLTARHPGIKTNDRSVTIEGCDGAFTCPPGTVLDLRQLRHLPAPARLLSAPRRSPGHPHRQRPDAGAARRAACRYAGTPSGERSVSRKNPGFLPVPSAAGSVAGMPR